MTLQKKKTTVTSRRKEGGMDERLTKTLDPTGFARLVDEHRLRATARRPPILATPVCPEGKQ